MKLNDVNNKQYVDYKKIIFFDGVCNLCNGFIDFVIKRDKEKKIFYCSLQSEIAIKFLAENQSIITENNYNTIYFYNEGKLFNKSSAILHVAKNLSLSYKIVGSILLFLPKFIRDSTYTYIANNRYRFFGKKETCRLPSIEERNQFL
jgi:predicted DCC family thiol-disulfide oxidoreductase YuxK